MNRDELSRIFVELPSFIARWKSLGLTDDDLLRLEIDLLSDPKIGAVMQGTGGVRKVRFAFENRGKSGSIRVIYIDFEVYEKIFLLTAYAKADQSSLTKKERNALKGLVELLELDLEKGEWKNV
mgnify:CR=1 FL=1